MDRAQKEKVVDELGQIFESSGVVVVAHYEGMTVAQMQDLRAEMRAVGGSVRVAKNKLAKIALEGKPGASMGDLLKGMTVFAYSEDPVAAAKVTDAYAKKNEKFVILGGAMGNAALDQAGVKAVARCRRVKSLSLRSCRCIGAPASSHRRCDWCACFEHREHPHHHRGAACRLSNLMPCVGLIP